MQPVRETLMAERADAVIIGAGVIGAAVAYELAKRGWKTLSLDRNRAPGHGSTGASCAIIRVHYSTLDGTALAWESYHHWRDWRDWLGAPAGEELARFRETGCLVMKTEINDHLARHIELSRRLGCPFEEWDAAAIRARLPIYDLRRYGPPTRPEDPRFGQPTGGEIEGGVFWPTAGYVTDPALSTANIVAAARRHGARFRFGVRVSGILRAGGRVRGVRLADGGEIHAPVVVNVAGPGSAKINAMAGVLDDMTIRTRPLKQEVCHVPAPPGFDFENDGLIVSDSDIGCYCRPERGNHILIGSEDPPCDPLVWVEDDENWDRSFTEQWRIQVLRYAQRVPTLPIPEQAKGVVDLYDASDDWIPIYDRSALGGFYMACGTSGNQYKNAPVAGRLMAELIEYCEAGNDHDAEPLAVDLPRIGHRLDLSFCSRRREINRESSFSVLG